VKVLIIGTGAGALALAIDLSQNNKVVLAEVPGFEHRLALLQRNNCVINADGIHPGTAKVEITTDWSVASECQVIVVVTVADAHEVVANHLVSHLRDGQYVVYMPGNGGSLFLREKLDRLHNQFDQPVELIEANTIPYGCRILQDAPHTVRVSVLTPLVLFSYMPNPRMVEPIKTLFAPAAPEMRFMGTVTSTLLSNPNPLFHTLPCLLNAGRIEHAAGNFFLYEEGITPSVMHALRKKDQERRAMLNHILGAMLSWNELEGVVSNEGHLERHPFLTCGLRAHFRGPDNIRHRYISEDTAAGLVTWERVGQKLGVPTPIISSEITLISALLDADFRELGNRRANLVVEYM
jgi:opine dehydrogenase